LTSFQYVNIAKKLPSAGLTSGHRQIKLNKDHETRRDKENREKLQQKHIIGHKRCPWEQKDGSPTGSPG